MTNFVNSSALTKLFAALFIFFLLLASIALAIFDTITRQAVPDFIIGLLEGGLLASTTILGVHLGGIQTINAQQTILQETTAKLPAAK